MKEKSLPPRSPKSQESATFSSSHLIIIDFKSPFSRENRTSQTNLELSLTLHLELEMNFISLSHTAACSRIKVSTSRRLQESQKALQWNNQLGLNSIM